MRNIIILAQSTDWLFEKIEIIFKNINLYYLLYGVNFVFVLKITLRVDRQINALKKGINFIFVCII